MPGRWQTGKTGNPKGRPKSGRALAELLRTELDTEDKGVSKKEVIVKRAVSALTTGILDFGTRKLKISAKDWNDLYKYTVTHLDGPAKDIDNTPAKSDGDAPFVLPADVIAPSFMDAYRDITGKKHTEYIFSGGRGSTKSSFVSLVIIYLIKNNPKMHALATRQVKDTLRDSVFGQLVWAITELGLSEEFKITTSPMEIEYTPTGQKIYFRGADDPGKIKSIKPQFGHIGILWFEELDQFHGAESIRKIEQSVIRGGDEAFIFKSFNPPQTANNWANKYLQIPKETQYQHKSNYLGIPETYLQQYAKDRLEGKTPPLKTAISLYSRMAIPIEWLGKPFIEEAEHLMDVNRVAYDHEYLGISNNIGGAVFTNVQQRAITDEEINGKEENGRQVGGFDRILHGLDWGYFPDPASYGKMHYDAARRILYIYGEARYWKKNNQDLYAALVKEHGYTTTELLIADSEDPKSVADFRAYGANCRGAEKGAGSVAYSMKWLQGLTAIVIDPKRAPYHAQEFSEYEYERTKDGEIISEYPDKNNHAIDDTRYATNMIWRKKGE